ncbi:MAG: hypothetical protein CO103_05155 [Chloroflexi bacterium CG_4_9_14_3_um_filter_45_9]|nr:MAG: hypothetical protein CO103_05155 [Chloroflexi bacterium CG_4_9_14_3_um_filter_45_9]
MSIGKKRKIVGNYTAVLMSFRKTFSPELVSGLFRNLTLMLKQVQHDNIRAEMLNPLNQVQGQHDNIGE